MADELIFDLDRPTPNVALERLRQAVLATDDAYLLIDMLLGLIDAAAAERAELRDLLDAARIRIDALNIRADTAIDGVDALQQQVAALTDRVAALEPPDPSEETP